jgi:hypothetical protein
MLYRWLANLVVIAHLAFIAFVVSGSLLARRWPWLVGPHLFALGWAVAALTVGVWCPLTDLEHSLRRRSDRGTYEGGFVDRYLEGVVFPERLTPVLRTLAAAAIVAGYVRLARARGRGVRTT